MVVESGREKDAAIGQEEPVGIREAHIHLRPGTIIVGPFVAEHGAALGADLRHVHGHIVLIDDTEVGIAQLFREIVRVSMGLRREDFRQRYARGSHGKRIAVKRAHMVDFALGDQIHDIFAPAECADGHATTD